MGYSDFQEYAVIMETVLNFIFWVETVAEDELSNFKRLKCCLKRNVLNLSRTISLKDMLFFSLLELFIYCT